MKDWIKTVECPIEEKNYYKKISEGETRKYYVETDEENRQILKVSIQSNENQE